MGSVGTDVDPAALTALERAGPRGYLRQVFPLKLDDDYDLEKIAQVLKDAYRATCAILPILAMEVAPDPDGPQAGLVKMQKQPPEKAGHILLRDLRAPGAYPYTYADIQARQFSVSSFDGDVLCDRNIWPTPTSGMPVSSVQVNFLAGGMVICWCVLHMVGDANTYCSWTKTWANECRRLQGLPVDDSVLEDGMMTAREQVMKAAGSYKDPVSLHPGMVVLPFTPTGPPPCMMSPSHRGQVFYFSPEALAAIKKAADPANATEVTGHSWVSTNDAFSALVWRATLDVQVPLDTLQDGEHPEDMTHFAIAVDCRKRTDPPVHPRALGCWLSYITVMAPIRKVLTRYNLADLAGLVRLEVQNRLDNQFTDRYAAIVDSLEDVTRLVPQAYFNLMGKSVILTSWADMEDLYELEWGPLLGNKIEAVRSPNNGILPGCAVILPRRKDGGLELLVGTEGALLPKLCQDPIFMEYAVAR